MHHDDYYPIVMEHTVVNYIFLATIIDWLRRYLYFQIEEKFRSVNRTCVCPASQGFEKLLFLMIISVYSINLMLASLSYCSWIIFNCHLILGQDRYITVVSFK